MTIAGVSLRAGHHTNLLDVRTILSVWIAHLEERFSYNKFTAETFGHLLKPVDLMLKMLNEMFTFDVLSSQATVMNLILPRFIL